MINTLLTGHSIKCAAFLFLAAFLSTACQAPDSKKDQAKDLMNADSIAGSGKTNPPATAVRQAGIPDTTSLKGDWFLQDITGASLTNLKTVYIRFDTSKNSFTGSTGCNKMKGVFWYSDNDTSLVFGDHFLTTKIACSGEESAFIRSLMNTNHYFLQNGRLTLLADGRELSIWKRAPVTQGTAKL